MTRGLIVSRLTHRLLFAEQISRLLGKSFAATLEVGSLFLRVHPNSVLINLFLTLGYEVKLRLTILSR